LSKSSTLSSDKTNPSGSSETSPHFSPLAAPTTETKTPTSSGGPSGASFSRPYIEKGQAIITVHQKVCDERPRRAHSGETLDD
jgi:hypothetical protein